MLEVYKILPVLGLLCLAGCASPPVADVRVVCLPMANYTPDQEKAMGRAYAGLPDSSALRLFVADSIALRDANRACLKSSQSIAGH